MQTRSRDGSAAITLMLASMSAAQPGACVWTELGTAPFNYGYPPQVVYHAGLGRVLLIESRISGTQPVRVWGWDGVSWVLLDGAGPPARLAPAAAYDTVRDRVVLFGGLGSGSNANYLNDTWEWDGASWMQRGWGPEGRAWHAMVFDPARARTVMFGGLSWTSGNLGDTWEWDGQSWSLASTTGPAPRRGHAMAHDTPRMRTILYGGVGPQEFADLWEWDGTTWLQRAGPTPGTGALWMVFDPGRARMVVGRQRTWEWRETWELDTTAGMWTLRDPGTAPEGKGAFDAARGFPLVVGPGVTMRYDNGGGVRPFITQQPETQHDPFIGAAVIVSARASGTLPLTYRWRRDEVNLENGANISGADTDTLTINPWRWEDAGWYDLAVMNHCGAVRSEGIHLGMPCYPNCDQSYVPPLLNVDDFTCYLNEFAQGQMLPHELQLFHYANCDGSTVAPVLNVDDFLCFMNRWAFGCP